MFAQNGARWFSLNVRVPPTWSLGVMLMTIYCTRANTLLYGVRGRMGILKHPQNPPILHRGIINKCSPYGARWFSLNVRVPPIVSVASHTYDLPAFPYMLCNAFFLMWRVLLISATDASI